MPAQPEDTDRRDLEVVKLVASGQEFGIEVASVREIRRWSPVTPLPHAPACLLGVTNLRGAVIPVFDLALRLGIGTTTLTPRHVTIIVTTGERTMGLLVDAVAEILKLPRDSVRPAPALAWAGAQLLKGMIAIDGGTLRLLDVEAVAPRLTAAA